MTPTLSSRMDPDRSARLRALLVDTVERTSPESRGARDAASAAPRRRRVPRPLAVGVLTVGAIGLGAGAAVSVTQFLQPDDLSFACVLGEQADAEQVQKRATVADAVASCRREWPADGAVPELAVFMSRYGIFVAPLGWDGSQMDAERVSQDVAFDPRPARLEAALGDWVDGLESDCFSEAEALARVEDDLTALGLAGWTVRAEDNDGREQPADGVGTCAWAMIPVDFGPEREVWVRGQDPSLGEGSRETLQESTTEAELRTIYTQEYRDAVDSGTEFGQSETAWVAESVQLTLSVRSQLKDLRDAFDTGRCLTADQAEQEVLGILDPTWNSDVDVSIDDTLACASVEVGMGGTWLVSIVGPEVLPGG
ncbi:hypothetical protein [Jannaschia sp. R86511]|uniref:hypothetical protein n=1 Tax=Jannaschia sp. R86511 TaxID=3093853 RepID=UPI0036D4178E